MSKGGYRADTLVGDNATVLGENGHRQYRNTDEIKTYLDCRYAPPIEAC